MPFCPNCGTEIEENQVQCPNCNYQIVKDPKQTRKSPTGYLRSARARVGALIANLFQVVGFIAFTDLYHQYKAEIDSDDRSWQIT